MAVFIRRAACIFRAMTGFVRLSRPGTENQHVMGLGHLVKRQGRGVDWVNRAGREPFQQLGHRLLKHTGLVEQKAQVKIQHAACE